MHRTQRLFGCASVALVAGLVGLAPAAFASTTSHLDPCAALSAGAVRQSAGGARHVVFAVASGYDSNRVTVTECARRGTGWRTLLRTAGRAGSKGFAPPGEKREGDGRSPSGSYTMTEAFGEGDPGTALPYRKLRSNGDCWGSTPGQPTYNEYYSGTCGTDDENLSKIMEEGPYRQAVVINYNRPPDSPVVPGYGSAIFFHIGDGGPTAGCISVSATKVRQVMRTLLPGDRIIMGTHAVVFG